MADGRRIWRVFDNLLNNIVKYALSGTRVYLDLAEDGRKTCPAECVDKARRPVLRY